MILLPGDKASYLAGKFDNTGLQIYLNVATSHRPAPIPAYKLSKSELANNTFYSIYW